MLKLSLNIQDNTYFISDTHFHHKKLCQENPEHFEICRNYLTTEEMDNDIITQWNKTVNPNDTVIFAGDFLMNTPNLEIYNEFWNLRNQLNGNIYFIRGNHDHTLKKKVSDIEFYDYAVLKYKDLNVFVQHNDYNENSYFLTEEIENGLDLDKTVLIHGHTHSSEKVSECLKFHQKRTALSIECGFSLCYSSHRASMVIRAPRR
jgi:calcineurin-like phosphoesterase family protein